MTPAPQNPEDNLSQTLARQADRFAERGGSSLDFEQVMSRAGEIRRGRRMRATIVMAAVVVAVAVPIGIGVVGNGPTNSHQTPAATNGPTGKPDKGDTNPIGLGSLKTGQAPKNGYYADGKLTYDGRVVPLEGQPPSPVVRMNGGFVVAQMSDPVGDLVAKFVGDDGTVVDHSWPTTGSIVASPERNVAVFVQPDGTVRWIEAGGSRFGDLGKVNGAGPFDVDAVVGENCSGRAEGDGCLVYVHSSGEARGVQTINAHGVVKSALPGMVGLDDVSSDGLLVGQTSLTDNGGCSSVQDGPNGNELWKNCNYSFDSFSPDGKYLLAHPPGDGAGPVGLVILDARTGDAVLNLQADQDNFVSELVWDDNTHVLASVYDHGKFGVERFALSGAREYATKIAPDADASYVSPFKLG